MKFRTSITIILTLIFSFSSNGLPAQITSAGNFMLGGTVGFSTAGSTVNIQNEGADIERNGTRATQFNIAPAVGYFIVEDWALGIGLDYTLNRVRRPVNPLAPQSGYERSFDGDLLFGPFSRYYFPIGADKAFFLEASVGFGSSRDEVDISEDRQIFSNNVFSLGVGPGFTIFSNDALGIEALVKYNWARSNANVDFQGITTETTTFTNQIDFSIGFQIYFSRIAPAQVEPEAEESENDRAFY